MKNFSNNSTSFLRLSMRPSHILKGSLVVLLVMLHSLGWAQSLIAGWDFQTTTTGGTAALAQPNAPTVYNANFGTGTLYADGTNGSSTWLTAASNFQITSFGGTAINAGTGFSTTTSGTSCLAPVNQTANGKSMVFLINMTGKANLVVSYATQRTTTGFNAQAWEYSVNGSTWNTIQTVVPPATFASQTLSTITGLDNISTAYLRVTFTGASAAAGNNRLDNIQMVASNVAPPVVVDDTAYATVGTPFSHFTSATGSPTSYSASGLSSWMSFNSTTGEITGTPTTILTGGVIVIDAFNPYGSGTGSTTVIVNPGTQTINFGSLSNKTFGDAPFTLTATGGASGNPVTFVSNNTAVATVSGNTVTIVGAGTTTITASQAGNGNYTAATDVTQTLIVNQASQTITFNALPGKLTTDPPFALTATGGASGNPVTYTSSNPAVATVSGSTVTIVGAGNTVITASQAGNANYSAATSVTQTLTVTNAALLPQTITFGALANKTYGDATVTLTATGGGSGNPITYVSSNTAVATISGNTMTILAPGTTTITASQAGNASYSPAANVSQTQIVNPKNLTLPSAAAFNKVYDGTTTATLFGLTLSGIVGTDNVTVSGTADFATANVGTGIAVSTNLTLGGTQASKYTLTQPSGLVADITKATQTITFGALTAKTYGAAPFTLTATGGGSSNPVTFTSDNPLVATVSGNTVTIVGAGTANITASQLGDANYDAATDVVQLLTVNKANQTITFAVIPSHYIGDAPFTLTATSNSTLPVSLSSSNTSVATLSGNVVTIVGVGVTSITASQPGDNNYNPANNVVRDLVVAYPLIAAWDFFGVTSPATAPATFFNTNLVSTSGANNVTRGATAAANSATNSFRTTGFKNDGISTSNTDYFQTTLKANAGYSLSLSSINANFAGTATFAATPGVTSQFAYSLDGTNFTLIGSPFTTVGTPASSPLIDVTSISALQNVNASKTVTIRYYASGQTTTGGWGFNSPTAGVNGLAYGGHVDICTPVSTSSNLTICTTDLPYTWNTQSLTAAGVYTYTTVSAMGCDSTSTLNLTVNTCTANSTLNLNCFIQGYYDAGTGMMAAALANQGETSTSTACDSIDVELHDENTPTTIIASTRTILNQDGTAVCSFPSLSGNYYIAVKHRSAIQTWSASPVSFATSTVNYNFTDSDSKAYGNNMKQVGTNVWAFYSGDIEIDDNIDLLDLGTLELDISNFGFGYIVTDLNGDGNVDLLDSTPMEENIANFIFSAHP